MKRLTFALTALALVSGLGACSNAYYGAMEELGYEKRDILVGRVETARDSQEEAKEQFESALEAFRSVVDINGGELESAYDRLSAEYNRAEADAQRVRDRINSVENVSEDLFREWRAELDAYQDPALRETSARRLRETEARYASLISQMRAAAARMDPVLEIFEDRVLFLKHNLNARAIASLSAETGQLEADVARLIAEMERAIAEADAFIAANRGT